MSGHSYKQLNNPSIRRSSLLHRRRWTLILAALLTVAGFLYFSQSSATEVLPRPPPPPPPQSNFIVSNQNVAVSEDTPANRDINVLNEETVDANGINDKSINEIVVPELRDEKKVEISGVVDNVNDMPSADGNSLNAINSITKVTKTNEIMTDENNQIPEAVSVINDVPLPVDSPLTRDPAIRQQIEALFRALETTSSSANETETSTSNVAESAAVVSPKTTNESLTSVSNKNIIQSTAALEVQPSSEPYESPLDASVIAVSPTIGEDNMSAAETSKITSSIPEETKTLTSEIFSAASAEAVQNTDTTETISNLSPSATLSVSDLSAATSSSSNSRK